MCARSSEREGNPDTLLRRGYSLFSPVFSSLSIESKFSVLDRSWLCSSAALLSVSKGIALSA